MKTFIKQSITSLLFACILTCATSLNIQAVNTSPSQSKSNTVLAYCKDPRVAGAIIFYIISTFGSNPQTRHPVYVRIIKACFVASCIHTIQVVTEPFCHKTSRALTLVDTKQLQRWLEQRKKALWYIAAFSGSALLAYGLYQGGKKIWRILDNVENATQNLNALSRQMSRQLPTMMEDTQQLVSQSNEQVNQLNIGSLMNNFYSFFTQVNSVCAQVDELTKQGVRTTFYVNSAMTSLTKRADAEEAEKAFKQYLQNRQSQDI